MTEPTPHDRRVDAVAARLREELEDDQGRPADADAVQSAVLAAADEFTDAPVQEFVPLLVEHKALDDLREDGLRRNLDGIEDDGPPPRSDEPPTSATPTVTPHV